MKSRILALCLCAAGWLALAAQLPASETSGTSGFSFLNLPVGARATAMGQAFTSVPNDVQGLPYNPAGLASMTASQLSFQHLSYVENVDQEGASFGHAGRTEEMSWGLSANYLRVGDITRTLSTGLSTGDGFTETGSFSTYDMALGASAAGPVMDDLKAGGTVKFIRESLSDASASAGAVDAGILYRLNDEHSWNVGVSLLNFGVASRFADAAVKLPSTIRAGISGQPFPQWLISTDFVKRVDTSGEADIGIEVNPHRMVSFRMGYRYARTRPDLGGLSDFSAGMGLRYNSMSFDYAFIPLGDLGITHRITVNYRFKPKGD